MPVKGLDKWLEENHFSQVKGHGGRGTPEKKKGAIRLIAGSSSAKGSQVQ